MWWKTAVVVLVVLALALLIANLYGAYRWKKSTKGLYAQIEDARVPPPSLSYVPSDLADLPAPVQRYLRTVLKEGQPLISTVRVEHVGTFNMSTSGEQWLSFESEQRVVTMRPGFVWDARIRMAPLMTVRVHDAYVQGDGVLTAKLFGFLTVMKQPPTPELAQGELMRFLAESAWYPTVLLPDQGVTWEAVDDTHARATLTDGNVTVALTFAFDEQGLISSVSAEGRYREVDGEHILTPWQGRFWDYEWRDGMLIPLEGEVTWLLDEGELPYWRGHIQRIEYEYAR